MTEVKGTSQCTVTWTAAGTTSDPVQFARDVVPAAIETDASWASADVQIEVRGDDGVWRTLSHLGAPYAVSAGASEYVALDPRATWALAHGAELRLVSSVSQTAGTTVTLRGQAWGV